jgi:glucans biosynthesis protein C
LRRLDRFLQKKSHMETKLIDDRRHDLDWLRLIAIFILLFYHTGMLFNTWGFHIKNTETSVSFNYWMVWLHFWRMPLLLFISGAGTYMALGKRSPGQYASERFRRLFIPLVFGMFVVVPPQIYYEHIREYAGYWDFYKTVFQFVPYPKGSFSWHHLWFVMYLFVFSLFALPYLIFIRSPRAAKFKNGLEKWLGTPAGLLFLPAAIILISQIILRPYFPEETHDLFHDWAYFTFYFCFFLFGMTCYSSKTLWELIGKNRSYLLVCTILVLIPFYGFYLHFREVIVLPWTMGTVETAFDVTAIFLSWFTVITVIAYGQHFLNRYYPWLSRVNEGLYPFYILHQTIIISLGYYICRTDWSITSKFLSISLLTLFICVFLIEIIIRPLKLLRLFFGLKISNRPRKI